MKTFDAAVPGHDAMGGGAAKNESQHRQHHSDRFIKDCGDSNTLGAQEATNAAEDDLREAR